MVHINIQSLLPKIEELRIMADDTSPDILTIPESWLSGQIPDGIIGISNYITFRFDRVRH